MKNKAFYLTLLAGLMLTGCPPKKKMDIADKPTDEQAQAAADADANAAETKPGDIEITQEWSEIPSLALVTFDYDSSSLDTAARSILKGNVAILKKLPKSVTVRVEGHCDDRGTIEYNIALGQRRANTVRSYYATAGIGSTRLETISYGEERPMCTAATDDCWHQNRRSVTKVKNKEPIRITATELQEQP